MSSTNSKSAGPSIMTVTPLRRVSFMAPLVIASRSAPRPCPSRSVVSGSAGTANRSSVIVAKGGLRFAAAQRGDHATAAVNVTNTTATRPSQPIPPTNDRRGGSETSGKTCVTATWPGRASAAAGNWP